MNASLPHPLPWSRARLWMVMVVALVIQVLVIYLLSDRKPMVPRRAKSAPTLYLLSGSRFDPVVAELLNLEDPTVLALPSLRGFSGPAWLSRRWSASQPLDLSPPQHWLTRNVADLGATFRELVRSNIVPHRTFADKPPPRVSAVNPPPLPLPAKSAFRIEGDLAGRELLTPVEIPPFAHAELLANTVIRVAVDASGLAFSPVVLSGSGLKAADRQALDLARTLRFKPLRPDAREPSNPASLTWGRLVFQWHTLELPATSAPAPNPQ